MKASEWPSLTESERFAAARSFLENEFPAQFKDYGYSVFRFTVTALSAKVSRLIEEGNADTPLALAAEHVTESLARSVKHGLVLVLPDTPAHT